MKVWHLSSPANRNTTSMFLCYIDLRMLILKRTLGFSSHRSLISKINRSCKVRLYSVFQYDSEVMIENLSNTSIKPFLNLEKIGLIKMYYTARKELKWPYSFVCDDKVAKDIVKKVLANTSELDQKVIVEGNPGLGLITINLIKSGISKIMLLDHSKIQEVSINQICEKYSKVIIRVNSQMHLYSRIAILSSFKFCWERGVPVTIIGVCHSLPFLRTLVEETLKYHLWENKFSIFLVLGDAAWKVLTERSDYHVFRFYQHSIFWVLFCIEEIKKYPSSAFLPRITASSEDMHLIKITHNPDFFNYVHTDELNEYISFIHILASSKDNFIVSAIEHWIPDCGPYLISKGISMTNMISDLEPREMLVLFKFMKEFEGYQDFSLLTSEFF